MMTKLSVGVRIHKSLSKINHSLSHSFMGAPRRLDGIIPLLYNKL